MNNISLFVGFTVINEHNSQKGHKFIHTYVCASLMYERCMEEEKYYK